MVITKFCPECDNIIFPKNSKLYCKACEKEFELDTNTDDFKIVKKIKHDEKETAPIVVKETLASAKISAQDRKAFEEFLTSGSPGIEDHNFGFLTKKEIDDLYNHVRKLSGVSD